MEDRIKTLIFDSDSEEETYNLARNIGLNLKGTELLGLTGELGAGKTVFVRGLAAGLGVEDESLVCSPSFTLVNVYKGRVPLFHVDLYRLEGEEEIADLGLEDYLGEGVMAVEWAEKMGRIFCEVKKLEVVIELTDQQRRKIIIKGLENFPEVGRALEKKDQEKLK